MIKLAGRAGSIKPSPTLSIDAKAKAMKADGIDVVGFGVGEPDFDTPGHIKDAAIKAIGDGYTKYMAVGGIDPLKDAIIEKLRRDNNLEYQRNEVIVSCGAKHSLYNLAQAMYGPGDEVMIPAPYWVSYPDQVLLNEAEPVIIPTRQEDKFALTPEQLEKHITPKTKALILNSPSNPTGLAYDKNVLEAVAELAVKHDFYVISDEIYEKLVYDGFEHVSIASLGDEIKARTFVVNGVSKSHAMTGWRMGYTAGPAEVIKVMTNIQSQSTSNPCSITQMASIEALNGPMDFLDEMLSEFDKRRRYMVERLNAMDGISCLMPVGAFYAFPNVSGIYGRSTTGRKINSSKDLAIYLLDEAKVAAVHGEAFGDDRFIRLSYATSMANIEKGLDRIEKALAQIS